MLLLHSEDNIEQNIVPAYTSKIMFLYIYLSFLANLFYP